MRIGGLITAYERPDELRECINALISIDRISRIAVIDNSTRPLLTDSELRLWSRRTPVSVKWFSRNIGVPAAITIGFRELAKEPLDAYLILDDDSVVNANAVASLASQLRAADVGAATIPTRVTKAASRGTSSDLFPWSPTMIRADVVEKVGPPLEELFFSYDDWEYAIRISQAGYRVEWVSDEIPRHGLGDSDWLGRYYFGARNTAYLATHKGVRHRAIGRALGSYLAWSLSPTTTWPKRLCLLRGLWDGAIGDMSKSHRFVPEVGGRQEGSE